jgi:hypothetical protein
MGRFDFALTPTCYPVWPLRSLGTLFLIGHFDFALRAFLMQVNLLEKMGRFDFARTPNLLPYMAITVVAGVFWTGRLDLALTPFFSWPHCWRIGHF